LDPYNVPVISVFDHSMKDKKGAYHIYGCDDVVTAYTGEKGERRFGFDEVRCGAHPGYAQEGMVPFTLSDDNYVGAGGQSQFLNYDGHPGFDYKAKILTEVYAVASGKLYYPTRMNDVKGTGAYGKCHFMALIPDSNPNYRIYYGHLSTHEYCLGVRQKDEGVCFADSQSGPVSVVDPAPLPGCDASVLLPLQVDEITQVVEVTAGCLMALSGRACAPQHLHLEVQKLISEDEVEPDIFKQLPKCLSQDQDPALSGKACVPVDPYGWEGPEDDPYTALTGVVNLRLWAHTPGLPPAVAAEFTIEVRDETEGVADFDQDATITEEDGANDTGTFRIGVDLGGIPLSGGNTASVTVTMSGNAEDTDFTQAVIQAIADQSGTIATSGQTATDVTLTWGEDDPLFFDSNLTSLDDVLDDGGDTLTLSLSNPIVTNGTAAVATGMASADLTITDDDGPFRF